MIAKCDILKECPVCNKVIYVKAGRSIPEGIEYVKTKRHTVVLVHKYCVNQEEVNK